jgi:hypothetical protein
MGCAGGADFLLDPVRINVGQVGAANDDVTQEAVVLTTDLDKFPWVRTPSDPVRVGMRVCVCVCVLCLCVYVCLGTWAGMHSVGQRGSIITVGSS